MKKTIVILITILFVMIAFINNVNASNVSIGISNDTVTVGQNVSVTISFGEKVSIAQFKLNYDNSKFENEVSCSAGDFEPTTGMYVYVNYRDEEVLESVTLTFKSKETGTVSFSISGVVLSGDATISNGIAKVTIEPKTISTPSQNPPTSMPVNPSTSVTTKPSTSTNAKPSKPTVIEPSVPSNNQDVISEETTQRTEIIDKTKLNELKMMLRDKVKGDYTQESWDKLQEAILLAERATTNSEYDAIKDMLTIDVLEKVAFEKEELEKVLRDLIDKSKNYYTNESWNELRELILIADRAELKSEYDAIKDKLTIDRLVLKDNNNILDNSCGHMPIIIVLIVAVVILLIIIIYTRLRKKYL